MPFDDDLVDVGGGGGVERLQAEVIEDEQVGAQELADLLVVAVAWPGGLEALEELAGPFEVHAVAGADGRVAERGGQERLCPPRPGSRLPDG